MHTKYKFNKTCNYKKFARCLEAVAGWLEQSRLRLNPSKTEVLWLGRKSTDQEAQLPTLAGVQLITSSSARNLGVILDTSLSMEAQVTTVARTTFFHLCQARLLAPYLSTEYLASVIHVTVTSRIDFCNSLC